MRDSLAVSIVVAGTVRLALTRSRESSMVNRPKNIGGEPALLATGHATFHWIVQSFAVALPEIQAAFGLNSVGVAGIMSARDFAAGLIALPGGVVVDVLRRHWGLLLGLFASAAVVLAFLPTTRAEAATG